MTKAEKQQQPEPTSVGPITSPEFDLVGLGMAQWRRERPDLDCSGKAVVGRVLHLEEIILRTVNNALAKHKLRYPDYAVLATLRVSGEPYQMSPTRLQATMLFTSGGVSNLLRRMEKRGYVKRLSDPADGRGVLVQLTPKGLAVVNLAMADHAAAERHLCASLGEAERQTLGALLSRMIVFNGAGAYGIVDG